MRIAQALKLHAGDEIRCKKDQKVYKLVECPLVQHTYDLKTKRRQRFIILTCAHTSYLNREVE